LIFLEIGIGSGIIFLSLLKEFRSKQIECVEIDINPKCIGLSMYNAKLLEIPFDKFKLILCSLEQFMPESQFDFIIPNPPYIANHFKSTLMKELDYESGLALFSGNDGLDLIRLIIKRSKELVKKGGFVILEISPEQEILLITLLLECQISYFLFYDDVFGRKRFLYYKV
jgi:HemK-like putative methylase